MAEILVVDDEPEMVQFLQRALESEGHEVETALDGADGLRQAVTSSPDLVILDLLMPGIEGRAVLSGLLAVNPEARVLVLSAEVGVRARVEVLEAGAIDFVSKPFATRELLARVRRRLKQSGGAVAVQRDVLHAGSLALELRARRLHIEGRVVALSQREFLLLEHMMRRSDRVCTREELLSEVWGYSYDPATNVVDVCVGRLRHKLRGDRIRTVRNVGYQLRTG